MIFVETRACLETGTRALSLLSLSRGKVGVFQFPAYRFSCMNIIKECEYSQQYLHIENNNNFSI